MKKICCLLLIFVLLFTIKVNASSKCDKNELSRLKELAKKIEFDYDYKLVDDKVVFKINAINLNDDLKALIINDYYAEDYRQFKNDGSGSGSLDGFSSGERVTVTFKAYVANWCAGETVLTRSIKLPYYNYYYSEEKCAGNEDFKYCKQLIDVNISQKDFDNQLALFIKNKNKKDDSANSDTSNSDNSILKIVGISVAVSAVIVIIVSIIIKKRKRNML